MNPTFERWPEFPGIFRILDQEKVSYEIPALAQLARAAQGSIRDSLSLTDQAIAQGNNQVTLATVVSMLGPSEMA